MSMVKDFFEDSFSEMENDVQNDTTFPFVVKKSEEDVLRWLNNDIKDKVSRQKSRLQRIRQIEAFFKGLNYKSPSEKQGSNGASVLPATKAKEAKVFVNFVNEMVEAKVAQRSRFKPAITILPGSDEIADKNNAQTCKQILDCKAQELDFEKIFSDGDKIQFLRGESYTLVLWDKLAGGLAKEVQELNEMGIKIPGKKDPMRGDLKIVVLGPDRCFPQVDKGSWDECNDFSVISWVHIDELKALYPSKQNKIFVSDENVFYWDAIGASKKKLKNHVMVVDYYHKGTRFLPDGYMCTYTTTCILEKSSLKEHYDHLKIPCVFDTDIDLEGELHGRPFTDNITRLQSLHNMTMASSAKGFAIAANPKWVAPAGSISINKTTNEYGLMEFKGAVPPQLVTFSGVPKDAWEMADRTEKYIEKQSSVYGISRGEPPKGIKAAVALQFLDEQELQRESRGMAKRQKRIIETYKLSLYTIAQHYTPEDGRIFQMLGSDNSYLVKTFNVKSISGYDIRLMNSSSLPDSKTGKIAAILDINQATQNDPYFGREEISTMLEMGNDQRFRDKLAISVKAADTIVQMIMDGVKGLNPNEWDDFVVQYPIFLRALQERSYKESELELVTELKEYITAMEYMMYEKAKASQAFAARISGYYMFPVFFKVPVAPPPPPVTEPIDNKQNLTKMQKDNAAQLQIQQKGEMPQ